MSQLPNGNGHPAWQPYLENIPESVRPAVMAAFQQWDNDVKTRMQEVNNQYAQYKPLLDNNIPIDYIGQALQLAQEVNSDPSGFFQAMNEKLELGFVSAEEAQSHNLDPNDLGLDDLADNPQIKALMDGLNKIQERFDNQDKETVAEQEAREFQEYLDSLVENTPFKDNDDAKMLITAFMTQGISGPDALAKVQGNFVQQVSNEANQNLNQIQNGQQQQQAAVPPVLTGVNNDLLEAIRAQTNSPVGDKPVGYNPPDEQAPVVMGNQGNVGSGIPTAPLNFGAATTDDITVLVTQALKNSAEA